MVSKDRKRFAADAARTVSAAAAALLLCCTWPALATPGNGAAPPARPGLPPAAIAHTASGTPALLAADWDADTEENRVGEWEEEEFDFADVDELGRGPDNPSRPDYASHHPQKPAAPGKP